MTPGQPPRSTLLAVCGAHLQGQPLHPLLERLGAVLVAPTRTAPVYRMVALPPASGAGPRPGLIRLREGGGSVEVEVYRLAVASLGELVVTVTSPLAIGQVLLADGTAVLGFVCESYADDEAGDITDFGSWREYLSTTGGRMGIP